MKKIIFMSALFCAQTVEAQSIIFLDEGTNSQQTLNIPIPLRGPQGCHSILTDFSGGPSLASFDLAHGSLCDNPATPSAASPTAATYQNSKTYTVTSSSGTRNINVTLKKTINGVLHGEHGNWVSNAAYDFDETLSHRSWVVFGIDRITNGSDRWVTRYVDPAFPEDAEAPGQTILNALNNIAFDSGATTQTLGELANLGAVNMSLGAPAGGTSDLRCGQGDGQQAVNELLSRGIAVVVGLQNNDIASDKESWPACLDNVVKVGGERASSFNGQRQIGVGANGGIDFFAKDTTNDNQEGNSFAAPRVASAYAKLHELFPFSTVTEKTQALVSATQGLTDTYRTRLINGTFFTYTAPKIRKSQLQDAITFLEAIYPPQDNSSTSLNLVDNNQYGPFFGTQQTFIRKVVNFDALLPEPNQKSSQAGSERTAFAESVPLKAGTGVLSSRRDLLIEFTGVIDTITFGDGFDLYVNNVLIEGFTGFRQFSQNSTPEEKLKSFVLNRKYLNDTGDNEIDIRPNKSGLDWGLRDISIKYLPIVPIQVGVPDSNQYGYEENPTRYTGLRMSFNLPEVAAQGYVLSATAFDMDRADESEVFINGNFLGHLNQSPMSSTFSAPNSFAIPSSFVRTGTNFIEFVQREPQGGIWIGFQDEKWAVKDILFEQAPSPDLAVTNLRLVNGLVRANASFAVEATFTNLGPGVASSSTATFYVSTDNVISESDLEINSFTVPALASNGTFVLNESIQTAMVGSGIYLGVCIDVQAGETSNLNNCSEAVELKSKVTLTPVYLLLLE